MNMNEQASLLAHLAVERDAREGLEARIELAADVLRGHFQQQRYVGTVPFAVVSEALAVLAGDDGADQ